MMKLQPWTARPDADELAEARRRFELPAVEDS
jgi:hypothetical protein